MILEDKVKNMPSEPGVYLMKDEGGQIIYIGKAISLKNRVRSYFSSQHQNSPKTRALVKNIRDIDFIITDSELEALILESNLIKKHRPKYNISLKDDKNYPLIKVTINEDFPRIEIVRKIEKDGAKYFGPFTSSSSVQETLKLITKIFPIRDCKHKTFARQDRPCLNSHINRCKAPCVGRISVKEYKKIISEIILFLEGKQEALVKTLKERMVEASVNLEFELAAELRDQLQAVEKIIERQKIVSDAQADQDVINIARGFDEVCVQIFFVRSGKLIGKEHFFIAHTDDDTREEIIAGFIKQYYNLAEYIPKEILIPEELDERGIIQDWLSDKKGSKVYLSIPKRGMKVELLELVNKNALQILEQSNLARLQKKAMTEDAVYQLQEELELDVPPIRIECYDISNTQGAESVASMVVFKNGKPAGDQYRRFKIKTVEGPNDFASMAEVIGRRFKNALKEEAENKQGKFRELPDLLIIDGGKGQLAAAREVMKSLGFGWIPTYGLAKENEWLFHEDSGEPIILPRNSKSLYLVQRIRDEAHRFAITYHRLLRTKRNLASVLDEIPGVGERRKQILLKHFGSLKKIKEASFHEIVKVEGITEQVAESIYNYFHPN